MAGRHLEGKIAVVTGGAGGMGSWICKIFAEQGAKVVVADTGADVEGRMGMDPSRVILLCHGATADLRSPFGATITIVLYGTPPMRFGVEMIAVRSVCAEASLPSIVRSLTLGDVPTSIWWTEDFSRTTPLQSLVSMGRQLVYDAWNRLVTAVDDATSATVGTYAYDGMNRRITKLTANTHHYYYSDQWQDLEERLDTGTTAERQFVWGMRYTDDLILRDNVFV